MASNNKWKKSSLDILFYLRNKCNNFFLKGKHSQFTWPFFVDNCKVGMIKDEFISDLEKLSIFKFLDKQVHFQPQYSNFNLRTTAINSGMLHLYKLQKYDFLNGWRKEQYGVWSASYKPLLSIERAAASMFGIISYGAHINGYTIRNGKKCLWLGRRSPNKPTYPGLLDNFAAGGLSYGMTVFDCAQKECSEEAGVSMEYSKKYLKPVNAVSYCYCDERGIFPEIEYCYDLQLPSDFVPLNSDGEMLEFKCYSLDEIIPLFSEDEFKPNSGMITIDFLMRHGYIKPDFEPHYSRFTKWMHMSFPLDY